MVIHKVTNEKPTHRLTDSTAMMTNWSAGLNVKKKATNIIFTYESIYSIAHICYGNSVHPSVTQVNRSKMADSGIIKFSPYISHIPLVFAG